MPLSLDVAEKMADAAKAKAVAMGCSVSVAVVDNGGYTLTVSRMDGALPLSRRRSDKHGLYGGHVRGGRSQDNDNGRQALVSEHGYLYPGQDCSGRR